MSDARENANCSLKDITEIFVGADWCSGKGVRFRTNGSLIRAPVEAQFFVTDLEQITFTLPPAYYWLNPGSGGRMTDLERQ